jgi:hypothetical protein
MKAVVAGLKAKANGVDDLMAIRDHSHDLRPSVTCRRCPERHVIERKRSAGLKSLFRKVVSSLRRTKNTREDALCSTRMVCPMGM